MNIKRYRQVRVFVALFVGAIVSLSVSLDSYILAVAGVLTGMIFMSLARSKTKIIIDERDKSVREQAAQLTYKIFTPTLGLGSFFLIMLGNMGTDNLFLFMLGQIFAYLTMFLIVIYSIAYFIYNRKLGGGREE